MLSILLLPTLMLSTQVSICARDLQLFFPPYSQVCFLPLVQQDVESRLEDCPEWVPGRGKPPLQLDCQQLQYSQLCKSIYTSILLVEGLTTKPLVLSLLFL